MSIAFSILRQTTSTLQRKKIRIIQFACGENAWFEQLGNQQTDADFVLAHGPLDRIGLLDVEGHPVRRFGERSYHDMLLAPSKRLVENR